MLWGSPAEQRSPRLSLSHLTRTLNGLIKSSPVLLQRGLSAHQDEYIFSSKYRKIKWWGQHVMRWAAWSQSKGAGDKVRLQLKRAHSCGTDNHFRSFSLHWHPSRPPFPPLVTVEPLKASGSALLSSLLVYQDSGCPSALQTTNAILYGPFTASQQYSQLARLCVVSVLWFAVTGKSYYVCIRTCIVVILIKMQISSGYSKIHPHATWCRKIHLRVYTLVISSSNPKYSIDVIQRINF